MRIIIKLLLRVLFTLLFRVRVRGDWQALQQERVLVVANHESFLDGMLLGVFSKTIEGEIQRNLDDLLDATVASSKSPRRKKK